MIIQLKAYTCSPSDPFLVIRERKKDGAPSQSAIVRLIRGAREFFGPEGLLRAAAIELDYLNEDSEDLPQVREGQYVLWFSPEEGEDYVEAFGWGWEIKRLPPVWRSMKGEAIIYQAGNPVWKIVYTFK